MLNKSDSQVYIEELYKFSSTIHTSIDSNSRVSDSFVFLFAFAERDFAGQRAPSGVVELQAEAREVRFHVWRLRVRARQVRVAPVRRLVALAERRTRERPRCLQRQQVCIGLQEETKSHCKYENRENH